MIYNVLLLSAVQQSESVIHIHILTFIILVDSQFLSHKPLFWGTSIVLLTRPHAGGRRGNESLEKAVCQSNEGQSMEN